MIEFLKRITRWDYIITALTGWWPHVNRLLLGSLSIVAVLIVAVLLIVWLMFF